MKAAIFSTLCLWRSAHRRGLRAIAQIWPATALRREASSRKSRPIYPPDAIKAGIGGIVKIECVVLADGTRRRRARVVAPLDPTVDAAAIQALKGGNSAPAQGWHRRCR